MADQSIPDFPADIDRTAFAHYLTGFADGEGSFTLSVTKGRGYDCYSAHFAIKLRQDDLDVLRLIQAFWGCGEIRFQQDRRTRAHPTARFCVRRCKDVVKSVIPHFDRYGQHAKKRHDFAIWRQGAELCWHVQNRRRKSWSGPGTKSKGSVPSWTQDERDYFLHLRDRLCEQHKYHAESIEVPLQQVDSNPSVRQELMF